MKHAITAVLSICSIAATAQECGTGRYTNYAMFPVVDTIAGVAFGSNSAVGGGAPQTLRMDVYLPHGDTLAARPVIICAFGGSFVTGTRADVSGFCFTMASLGYVAIAPDYRVGFFLPNAETTTLAVVRCMHDLKGCVRYLRKSAQDLGNPWHIDPQRIILGGVSAGAIGALHATYLDETSEIPSAIYPDTASIGGLEGNSGPPGYSSDVLACFSMSGCLGDTSWILPGDQPLCMVHEVGDPIVPYGTAPVYEFGFPTGITASGSSDIHRRFEHLGLANCFLSYPDSQHVGYLNFDPFNSVDFVVRFCADVVCQQPIDCGTVYAGIAQQADPEDLRVFPDPAGDRVHVTGLCATNARFALIDASGRNVVSGILPTSGEVDVSPAGNGLYRLLINDGDRPPRSLPLMVLR